MGPERSRERERADGPPGAGGTPAPRRSRRRNAERGSPGTRRGDGDSAAPLMSPRTSRLPVFALLLLVIIVVLAHPGLLAGAAGVLARALEQAVPGDPVEPVGVGGVDVAPVEGARLLQPVAIGLGHLLARGVALIQWHV